MIAGIKIVSCHKATVNSILLHDQLKHFHHDVVKHVSHSMNKSLTLLSAMNLCNFCQLGKSPKLPLQHIHTRSTYLFDIIHVDL